MEINKYLVKKFQLKVLFNELCTLCDFTTRESQYLGTYTKDLELLLSKVLLDMDTLEVDHEKN